MSDVAVLGFEIDSGPLKSATRELDSLSSAAVKADGATKGLSTTGAKSETVMRAMESAAKRLGVSVEDYAARTANFNRQTDQLSKTTQAVTTAQGAASAAAVRMLGSYNGISLVFQGITAAASAYFALTASSGPTLEKSLEEQARLLGLVKNAYRDAADQAGKFFNSSKEILTLQTELNIGNLQTKIREQIADALKSVAVVTPNFDPGGNPFGASTVETVGPFKAAVDALRDSAGLGAEAIEKFRNTIAELGNKDATLKGTAGVMLEVTQAGGDAADKVKELYRVMRLLKGEATKDDREGLGLSNRVPKGPADPFQGAENAVRRHIAAMNADADAVGKTAGEHARLRAEAQLLEAAQQKGGTATDAQRKKIEELGQAASDAAMKLARAQINDQIKFDRNTIGLSQEDVQIAQQLKGIYPDVTTALGSTEAAQMRLNNAMRAGNEIVSSFGNDLFSGLMRGEDAMKSLTNAASNLIQKLASKNLSNFLNGGSLFGTQSLNSTQGAIGIASAGLGGYQSGNALTGALGGAMAGASFGPAGMAIGGIAGLIGGILGADAKQKEALKNAKAEWEMTAPNFGSFLKPAAPAVANDNTPATKEDRDERMQHRRAA